MVCGPGCGIGRGGTPSIAPKSAAQTAAALRPNRCGLDCRRSRGPGPRSIMCSALAAASDRSSTRPRVNGPRSLTTTSTLRSLLRSVTLEPGAEGQCAVRGGEFARVVSFAGGGAAVIILVVIGGDAGKLGRVSSAANAAPARDDQRKSASPAETPYVPRHRSSPDSVSRSYSACRICSNVFTAKWTDVPGRGLQRFAAALLLRRIWRAAAAARGFCGAGVAPACDVTERHFGARAALLVQFLQFLVGEILDRRRICFRRPSSPAPVPTA